MINKIWAFFIIVGILFCLLNNKINIVNEQVLKSTVTSLEMIIKILPVMALWLGIMNIAKKSGLLIKFSNLLSPLLTRIFPEIPKNNESFSFMASNIIANIFGLGNAATPFGLKSMQSLQTLNKQKDTATRSMITFLVINTSGLTIIPTTIISLRMMYDSKNPTEIILACIVATLIATVSGLIIDYLLARRCFK
ncbi:MAG: nucleoside recognition domain-containing protein [Bacilli bacterium]